MNSFRAMTAPDPVFQRLGQAGTNPAGRVDRRTQRLLRAKPLTPSVDTFACFSFPTATAFPPTTYSRRGTARVGVRAARTALDLGSGLGTVGMIAAWRLARSTLCHRRGAGGQRPARAQIGSVERTDGTLRNPRRRFPRRQRAARGGKIRSRAGQPAVFSAGQRRGERTSAKTRVPL